MKPISRLIAARARQALQRQKFVLLLGPRQTGKTTLVETLDNVRFLNVGRP